MRSRERKHGHHGPRHGPHRGPHHGPHHGHHDHHGFNERPHHRHHGDQDIRGFGPWGFGRFHGFEHPWQHSGPHGFYPHPWASPFGSFHGPFRNEEWAQRDHHHRRRRHEHSPHHEFSSCEERFKNSSPESDPVRFERRIKKMSEKFGGSPDLYKEYVGSRMNKRFFEVLK